MDLIIVTNHEVVPEDDFYLSDEWLINGGEENIKKARELAKEKQLYYAYEVPAKSYALYHQMDASQILIDDNDDTIVICESAVIDNEYSSKWEAEY